MFSHRQKNVPCNEMSNNLMNLVNNNIHLMNNSNDLLDIF